MARMLGQAGIVDVADGRVPGQHVATRSALAQCQSIRTANVLIPRRVSQASKGPATAPVAFSLNARLGGELCTFADHRAAHHVGVAVEVLRGAVHRGIRAQVTTVPDATANAGARTGAERRGTPRSALGSYREP